MLQKISALVQRHPVTWRGAWSLVHHLPFLLPHDASYRGIKHLGLPPDGLLLDVGANDGISALSFRRLVPSNPILSIEISPRHEPTLRAMKQRMPKFDYVLVGAGEKHDTLRLFTPIYRGILLHTFAGVDRANVQHTLVVAFGQAIADRCVMLEDNTVIQPLDELNASPAFIKIDVEGMGNAVLRGLRQTLEQSHPALMIEVEPDEIDEMLGFMSGFGYKPMVYDSASDQLNAFQGAAAFFDGGNKNLYFTQ
ncbi:FkbM family methyltransferase [Tardiphaga sp. 367_B4_N1_1]|uniref:FkbM family methyltransferase n=1 Tax=Tardiphaga sp. 367_B4_N1_1 TaxID=3240777 RepID=UPI003F297398